MAPLSLINHIDELMFRLVNLKAPDWYINPNFKTVLAKEHSSICADTPLTFAPGLLDVVQSDTPPDASFFKSTPKPKGKFWAVYAALLTKEDSDPHLYIGSGTQSNAGYKARIEHYSDKKHPLLPRFVRRLYDDGYELAHVGLLCWMPIPSVTIIPRARLRLLAVEATFTNIFYSAFHTCMDGLWTGFMPWSRTSVEWRPLNTHSPFTEGVTGDLHLTSEELLRAEEERKARVQYHSKKQYMKERYDAESAEVVAAFLLRKRTEKAAWAAKNRDKVLVSQAKTLAKIKRTRRWFCSTCNSSLHSSRALNKHNASERHKELVRLANGGAASLPSKNALNGRKARAKAHAEKRYWCKTCQLALSTAAKLTSHKKTKGHLKQLAKLSS